MIGSEKDIVSKDSNKETEKVTINIFGACASRDLFPEDTEYKIQQCVSFSSPMSLYQPKGNHIIKEEDLESLTWGSPFEKQCLLLDNNKESINYLTEKKSDWLLLDFADIRLKLVKYGNNTTSLKFGCHVRSDIILSIHIHRPDCGGIQYSIASTKSLSQLVASASHISFAAA